MKNILILMLLFSMTGAYAQNPVISIIPQPVELKQTDGVLIIDKNLTISFDGMEAGRTAEVLAQKMNQATGFSVKPVEGNSGFLKLILNKEQVPQLGKEGYTLE